jgi:hypothetical protein
MGSGVQNSVFAASGFDGAAPRDAKTEFGTPDARPMARLLPDLRCAGSGLNGYAFPSPFPLAKNALRHYDSREQ